METLSQIALSAPAPRHVPDLRPSADAAATRRIDQPVGTTATPSLPGAAVMATFAGSGTGPPAGNGTGVTATQTVGRVLKPYGVYMLPATDRQPDLPSRRDPASPADSRDMRPGPAPAAPGRPGPEEPAGLDPRALNEGRMAGPRPVDRTPADPDKKDDAP